MRWFCEVEIEIHVVGTVQVCRETGKRTKY